MLLCTAQCCCYHQSQFALYSASFLQVQILIGHKTATAPLLDTYFLLFCCIMGQHPISLSELNGRMPNELCTKHNTLVIFKFYGAACESE